MEENTQFSDSTVGKIISNLSITLSHVKDALLKDFLEDMSSYIPGITAATSYKDFETYLEKAYKDKTMPAHFSVFINGLFERLGYNISNYEKDTKLQDLVKAIIATTFNFKDLINSLLNGNTDWQKEVMDILNATEAGAEEKMPAIKKLFNDPDLNKIGEESSSFAAGFMFGDGLLSKIIQLIIQIVTLCKQVKNLQLDDLKRADEKFGAFMEATNFSQQFAARIFDHIMVILIRNGKELFAADLDVVLDVLLDTKENKDKAKALEDKIKKDLEKKLKEEGKNLVETEFQTSITQIKDLRKKVKELEKQTTGAASILLKNTKAELSKLTKELFPDYDTIGKVFSKIYAVLDFLKVFDEELIEVVEYGKDLAAQIDLSKINEYITTINEGDDSSDEKADALKKAKKALKSPISKLNVIKWNNLEKLCTKPVDYITSLYPIKDFDDAEKLLAKILKLIKIFSDGTLDFDSLRKLLYEFATRIWNLFKNAKEDAKQELLKLQNFIIDLIKVHEKFAIGVKNELTKAFDEFLSGADAAESIIDKLVNEYIVKELEKLKEKGKIPGTNIKFKKLRTLPETEWKEQLSRLYATPLAALLNEKAQADKAFNKISQTEWEGFVTGQLLTDYYTAIGNMEEYISELYDAVDNWEDKFKKLIKELKEDFTKNIGKKIADSPHLINSLWKKPLSEMEGYIKKIEENINKNEDLKKSYTHLHFLLVETGEEKTPYKYPFSDFDYVEYFSNFANKIKNIAPCDLDSIYYLKFKEITISAISDKLKAKGIAEDKARAFLANVFSAFWADMKTLLYKNLIRPYASVIEKSVKSWLKEVLIHNIFDEITQRIDDHLNFEQYKDIFSKDNFTSVGVKMIQEKDSLDVGESWGASPIVLAKKLLALGIELKDISSLSDGIKFITNLYKAIKPDLLKKLSGVVELPMLDFSNIALPSYKLDIQNKFFALTVYEYPEKKEGESKKEDEQNGISLKLVAFAGERKLDSDGEEVESGIFLLPVIRGNYNNKGFALGQNHILKLGVTGSLNNDFSKETVTEAGKKAALENELFGFFLTNKSSNPLHTSLEYLNNDALQIYLELLFERTKDNPLQIFNAEYAALKVDNYPQKIFAGLNKGAFDFGYLGKLDKMEFALKLHKLNAFFEKILKDDIIIKLSKLELGYSWAEGLRVDGAFKVRIPIQNNFDLSIVKFNDIMLELGASTFNKNAITASLLTNFNVDFSGINISFTEMGLALNINYKSPDGSFGDFDLMPKFQFPSGLGIAIDIGPVTGGGLVRWNKEKEEFFGALELTIANVGGISALLLFNLRMPDGSKGFSFMGAISMFFTPGLPLPMGFSLTGVGGTFGLNRKIETDKLRDAIRCGALESILLVKDLENNLDFVLANAAQYYPVQQNQHFFGILAQLTWTKILKADLGLFIQFPKPMVVIIAGSIRIRVSDSTEGLLSINVDFLGGIDFSRGLFFDASIVNSKLVGLELYGDMSLRIYWAGTKGQKKGFLLSVGGFHPEFNQEEIKDFNVGKMKRMGLKIECGNLLKLKLEGYFAITPNTVQFGASVDIKIGWDSFGLIGSFSFNVLFAFNPFAFKFDIEIKLSVKLFGITLLGISAGLNLSGPARWNAKGHAKIYVLFFSIKVSFNESWGKSQKTSDKKYIEVLPLYAEEFQNNNNWQIISGDLVDGLVQMVRQEEKDKFFVQPSDRISFTQHVLPFGIAMSCYGEEYPGDVSKVELVSVKIGDSVIAISKTTSSFAPSFTRELSLNEKLKLPSFEDKQSGFELPTNSFGTVAPPGLPIPTDEFEEYCEVAKPRETTSTGHYKYDTLTVNDGGSKKITPKKLISETTLLPSTGKYKKPASRASMRRTGAGFNRYVSEWDRNMNTQFVSHLMDELNAKLSN